MCLLRQHRTGATPALSRVFSCALVRGGGVLRTPAALMILRATFVTLEGPAWAFGPNSVVAGFGLGPEPSSHLGEDDPTRDLSLKGPRGASWGSHLLLAAGAGWRGCPLRRSPAFPRWHGRSVLRRLCHGFMCPTSLSLLFVELGGAHLASHVEGTVGALPQRACPATEGLGHCSPWPVV